MKILKMQKCDEVLLMYPLKDYARAKDRSKQQESELERDLESYSLQRAKGMKLELES